MTTICNIIDTLSIARKLFPGKKNNLDALCKRYNIPISHRAFHSAIIDAILLQKVYIKMTSKQKKISFSIVNNNNILPTISNTKKIVHSSLKIQKASSQELLAHKQYLKNMLLKYKKCIWYQ